MEKELMNMFRQLKLSNSLFRDDYMISHFEFENTIIGPDELKRMIQEQSAKHLAKMIVEKLPHTRHSENEIGVTYRTECLVLKLDDFKTIVEACIQEMPIEKIQEIKNGKSL